MEENKNNILLLCNNHKFQRPKEFYYNSFSSLSQKKCCDKSQPQHYKLDYCIDKLGDEMAFLYCNFNKEHCKNRIPSRYYCQQCELLLCKECVQYHKDNLKYVFHKRSQKQIEDKIKCKEQEHHNNEVLSFCCDCQEYLCSSCKEEHNNEHNTHILTKVIDDDNLKLIQNDMTKAKRIILEAEKLKESYVNKLQELIEEINEAFNEFKKQNNNYLIIAELFLEYYQSNKNDYYAKLNLLNCTNFNLKDFQLLPSTIVGRISDKNINELFTYFSKKLIYHTNPRTVSTLKTGSIEAINIKYEIEIENEVTSLIGLNDKENFACGTSNGDIEVFNIVSYKEKSKSEIKIENAHEKSVIQLYDYSNNCIISAGDVSIKLWDINLDKQEYKNKLIIFESWDYLTLFTLNQHNNQIYFCNQSNNIKIFNLYKGLNDSLNYKEEFTIKSPHNNIIALFQPRNSEQLFSFCKSNKLIIWDLHKGTTCDEVNDIPCSGQHSLYQLNAGLLLVGGERIISVLDIIQLNVSKVITNDTFNGIISGFFSTNVIVLCGCQNKLIQLDKVTYNVIGKELEINKKENEVLFHSQLSDKVICSGGGKGNNVITIWEI